MSEAAILPPLSVLAAMWLFLRQHVRWAGWPATVAEVLRIVGAGRSQAHEKLQDVEEWWPLLVGRPGRPTSRPRDEDAEKTVVHAAFDFVAAHPGAMCGSGARRTYSDDYRRFVVGLIDPGQLGEGMSAAELSVATHVRLGTLKDWLNPPRSRPETSASPAPPVGDHSDETGEPGNTPADFQCGHLTEHEAHALEEAAANTEAASCPPSPAPPDVQDAAPSGEQEASTSTLVLSAHVRVIADQWSSWQGTFRDFCKMLRAQHRLSHGDTVIGNILQSLGLRHRKPQGPVEAPWSGDTFRSLFPGAQWLGDGTTIGIRWGDRWFAFNVEANLDVASNGFVGFHVSDSEDEEALRRAFEAGVQTSGAPPIFLTLDNRPSNHSPGALEGLKDTVVVPSTPGRGQAKAPLEGMFGLFQQAMPPLAVDGKTDREMARSVVDLVMTAWARGRNGKPRKRLNGRTPAEYYASARPTQQELDEAVAWMREMQRRQERARRTREARRDPARLELLTRGLAELGIPDSEKRLAVDLACYSTDAIVYGLAKFRTKLDLGVLPPDADHGRYLGGIIRNYHIRLELERTSHHLLEQRIRLRDVTLAPLTREADRLRAEVLATQLPQAFVDRALHANWDVDFRFWTRAAAEALSTLSPHQRAALYHPLCRRAAASFKTDRERREVLIDRLAQAVAYAAA